MVRAAPGLAVIVLALLLPALAGDEEPMIPDPPVTRLLGDGAGRPMQVTLCISAEGRAGGVLREANSRSVCGPATAPFRVEMKLGAEPDSPEVRAEVRLEGGLVVYDLTCLAPPQPGKNDPGSSCPPGRNDPGSIFPPCTLRAVARGACSSFGELAVLPVPRVSGFAEVRVIAWLSVFDPRDRDLFPPNPSAGGASPDRTVSVALRSIPPGRSLPGETSLTAPEADSFLRDAGARDLRRLSLRLAPGMAGTLESLVERDYIADFDVEVAQSPTSFIADPIMGAVPVGLTADFGPETGGLNLPSLRWSYTAMLGMEDFEVSPGCGPPGRIQIPTLGTTAGHTVLGPGVWLLPLAALADGGTLILDARAGPVE
ncbi:MAG: hypothetical protein MUE73_05185 [Planctomycetes bacterium]|nr:hypothetical protein [Planctomycetota bacterium]